jgi:HEAT repeat protein
MLDQAFETLKTYDWGMDPNVLRPITDAIVKSYGDAAARKDLETRLIAVLKSEAPRAAKDAVCRALQTIGTAESVPALAALLPDEKLSHMGRHALERIPAPEAGQALRDALPKVAAKLKVGIISSLGVRGEAASVAPLQTALADSDAAVVSAAARGLGTIGIPDAAKALASAMPDPKTKAAIDGALLECAEDLLAAGKKPEAKAAYGKILAGKPSKHVELAANLGIKASS